MANVHYNDMIIGMAGAPLVIDSKFLFYIRAGSWLLHTGIHAWLFGMNV